MNSATGTSGASVSTCASSGTNIVDKTIAYDALGDITNKSDVGTYSYPASGAGAVQPHAVTGVTGTYLGLTNPILAYDANGNLTCVSSASGCTGTVARQVTYTSFNMTASLTQGSTLLCLAYDSEHARIQQTATTTSGSCASPAPGAATTTYVNDPVSGAMEEAVSSGGPVAWRDYIKADGQIVAERSFAPAGTPAAWGSPTTWNAFTWSGYAASVLYFSLDHLGSIAVVTNASGSVVERDSYDAWGRRRNANGTDLTSCAFSSPPSQTTRGFTNQEMMDSVCLVNLNARLYDPTLGRFMAADPVIGSPFSPQELNRFTYVLNNPLSLTDPSGLCFLGCFWNQSWFRDIIAIVAVFALQQWEVLPAIGETLDLVTTDADLAAIVNGGILGGIGGLIATGTLKGAGLGVLQGALFAEAGNLTGGPPGSGATAGEIGAHDAEEFVAHGLVGGLVSEIQSGNFISGFLAGGIGSLGPDPTSTNWTEVAEGTIEHAVLGGFGAVLGGGKFENGAITGAFGYLLNDANHVLQMQDIAGQLLNTARTLLSNYGSLGLQLADHLQLTFSVGGGLVVGTELGIEGACDSSGSCYAGGGFVTGAWTGEGAQVTVSLTSGQLQLPAVGFNFTYATTVITPAGILGVIGNGFVPLQQAYGQILEGNVSQFAASVSISFVPGGGEAGGVTFGVMFNLLGHRNGN